MKKYGLILFLFTSIINAQSIYNIDRVFKSIQYNQYYKAKLFNEKSNIELKQDVSEYLDYLINGNIYVLDTLDFSNTPKNKLIQYLIYGENLLNKAKPNDSLAYIYYKKAINIAKKQSTNFYLKIAYQKMCDLLLKNNYSNQYLENTITAYKNLKNNSTEDLFWIEYYTLSNRIKQEKLNFTKGYEYANTAILKASLLQLEGIYCANYSNDFLRAETVYNNALLLLKPFDDYYIINKRSKKIQFNIGIVQFQKKKYLSAIKIFKAIDLNKKDSQIKLFKYHWLTKCYDSLGNIDSAYYYNIIFNKLKDSIDKKGHTIAIIKTETNEIISKKQEKINNLISKMNIIIPVVSIVILLLGIVFYLYKKYYHKSEVLAEEKSETIKKIDELKQVVVKNHIILKDKTKVYIADLLYIKSDDHYLKIFLSNGKNHFVRGKLNKITKELPPNFIRCHRSYIVNRNFIRQINNDNIILVDKTEIPLSRTYKNRL